MLNWKASELKIEFNEESREAVNTVKMFLTTLPSPYRKITTITIIRNILNDTATVIIYPWKKEQVTALFSTIKQRYSGNNTYSVTEKLSINPSALQLPNNATLPVHALFITFPYTRENLESVLTYINSLEQEKTQASQDNIQEIIEKISDTAIESKQQAMTQSEKNGENNTNGQPSSMIKWQAISPFIINRFGQFPIKQSVKMILQAVVSDNAQTPLPDKRLITAVDIISNLDGSDVTITAHFSEHAQDRGLYYLLKHEKKPVNSQDSQNISAIALDFDKYLNEIFLRALIDLNILEEVNFRVSHENICEMVNLFSDELIKNQQQNIIKMFFGSEKSGRDQNFFGDSKDDKNDKSDDEINEGLSRSFI